MGSKKLSLFSAILININIMLGSGIFINTVLLTKKSGPLAAAIYPLVAILIFPIIHAVSYLLKENGGTFYDFGKIISPFAGFLGSWFYFTAKMASAALAVNVCISLLQQIFLPLQIFNILILDISVILFFMLLNMLHLKIGRSIQFSFIILKIIPILFVILSGVFLFSGQYFTHSVDFLPTIPAGIPFVLYVFSGFEASCSLSSNIQNPEKNAPKAILISYLIVVTTVTLFQLMFFVALGGQLTGLSNYLGAFPALINKLFFSNLGFKSTLLGVLNIGVAASALGAAYGIMYSNSWNLFALAENNTVFFSKVLTSLNKHSVPYICIILETILAILYLLITGGYQVPLQQISAFGGTVAYIVSAFAFTKKSYTKQQSLLMPVLSILSCLILLAASIKSILIEGLTAVVILITILLLGSVMFWVKDNSVNN